MSSGQVVLAAREREELERRARSRSLATELVKRAKVILMLANDRSYSEISEKLTCTDRYISTWKLRFKEDRLAGLDSRYRGAAYRRRTAQTEARILELTRRGPRDGSTHWSSYRLAKELGISQSTVSRVWRQFGLQPHRSRSYMASNDPEFEEKAADIIGLYLKPPLHAAVFCVDEKSAIQALDRLDPILPLSPGRAERHGFEYYRHGTLSLYSALNTQTGQVLAKTYRTAYQRGVCRFPGTDCGQSTRQAPDPRHCRQPQRAQDQKSLRISCGEPHRPNPLHADLFQLA